MKPTTITELAEIVEGDIWQGEVHATATGVSINTQHVQPGDLFAAFVGERVDAHQFIPDAFARGAVAALVTHTHVPENVTGTLIRVKNPLTAIQQLASHERNSFSGPVIGVTGSNGKTTTKEMLGAVFQVAGPCLYTPANLNTELGLPLTILQRKSEHRSMILEMGMRGRGQIATLCEIAKPTAGLITNIGHSHIELLGSQADIADAKAELLESLPAQGIAVLNQDDVWLRKVASKFTGTPLWFSLQDQGADAFATEIQTVAGGTHFIAHVLGKSEPVQVPTYGLHNVLNALGALLLGAAHNLSLSAMAVQLAKMSSFSGRLNIVPARGGRLVIDDCYNASPASMQASLGVLRELAAGRPTVAILGDMYELGQFEEEAHHMVGQYVCQEQVTQLITIGPKAAWIAEAARAQGHPKVLHYPDQAAAYASLDDLPSQCIALVKASRGMHFEELVKRLVQA